MDKIKEKPRGSSAVREKGVDAVRRGLEGGADRLRTQLRDAAQQGQRDEYGGDQIEDAAARAPGRVVRAAEGLARGRKHPDRDQTRRGYTEPEASKGTSGGTVPPRVKTQAAAANRTGSFSSSVEGPSRPAQPPQAQFGCTSAGVEGTISPPTQDGHPAIKTKERYIREQAPTPVTHQPYDKSQGTEVFIQERGRKMAADATGESMVHRAKGEPQSPAPNPEIRLDGDPSLIPGKASSPKVGEKRSTGTPRASGRTAKKPATTEERGSASLPGQTRKAAERPGDSHHVPIRTRKPGRIRDPTIKTLEHSRPAMETAVRTAQKVQAAQRTILSERRVAWLGVRVKRATHRVTHMAKAAWTAARGGLALLAAGGPVVLAVVVLICIVGLVVASPFGIFFSGENSGTGQTIRTVIQEINQDYQARLDELRASAAYDVVEVSGSRAVWKEVLAVYAVRTTTDSDNAQEVATMDEGKCQILEDIFWEMNQISHTTETRTETVVEVTDDGSGNLVETEVTVTRIYLLITVRHRTAQEMADYYAFDQEQRDQLAELLDKENGALWMEALYGVTGEAGDLVAVALSQVGNVGGEPYWSWYGFNSRVDWCACFVSWCADQCGYIEAGVIPKFAGCIQGSNWFKNRGHWQDNSYIPSPGDIIFYDWEGDGLPDHVGIVERVENGRVYTVEGNSGDMCRQNSYPAGSAVIYGYGLWAG